MQTKKNAPTKAGTSVKGATEKSSDQDKNITSEKIRQVLELLAEISKYATIKMLALTLLLLIPVAVKAEAEPEIILIGVVAPTPTEAPKMPIQPMQTYNWDQKLIDALASIYWAETGSNGPITSQEKLMITQLIWNRSHHGSPFPEDLLEVCKQKNEFNRGKISDRNRETAKANLDKIRSQAEGFHQGIPIEMSKALYMGRTNGVLTFYDDSWNCIYEVK